MAVRGGENGVRHNRLGKTCMPTRQDIAEDLVVGADTHRARNQQPRALECLYRDWVRSAILRQLFTHEPWRNTLRHQEAPGKLDTAL